MKLTPTNPLSSTGRDIIAPIPVFRQGATILFQGDSITDGGRGRNEDPNHILGHGYAFIIAAKYGAAFPALRLTFLNRGCSGNTVNELASRWQQDTLALHPDILSILIGVNDQSQQIPLEQYAQTYDNLLTATLAENPQAQLVLGEPFTLPVGAVKNDWETWSMGLQQRRQVVAHLAAKHHAALVRFQQAFDVACAFAPADHWIWDGVHPTYAGHQIMADAWIQTVRQWTP